MRGRRATRRVRSPPCCALTRTIRQVSGVAQAKAPACRDETTVDVPAHHVPAARVRGEDAPHCARGDAPPPLLDGVVKILGCLREPGGVVRLCQHGTTAVVLSWNQTLKTMRGKLLSSVACISPKRWMRKAGRAATIATPRSCATRHRSNSTSAHAVQCQSTCKTLFTVPLARQHSEETSHMAPTPCTATSRCLDGALHGACDATL